MFWVDKMSQNRAIFFLIAPDEMKLRKRANQNHDVYKMQMGAMNHT